MLCHLCVVGVFIYLDACGGEVELCGLNFIHGLQLLINLLLNLSIVFSINCCYHNTYNLNENM